MRGWRPDSKPKSEARLRPSYCVLPFRGYYMWAAVFAALGAGLHATTATMARGCSKGDSEMHLQMIEGSGAAGGTGAPSCIDGSPYGFWIQKTSNSSHANDWQLYFQGGGWCYSAIDCYGRGQTSAVGTSTKWSQSKPQYARPNTIRIHCLYSSQINSLLH